MSLQNIRKFEYGPRGAAFARLVFRALGWRVEGARPAVPKAVLTCAPHSTNWDLFWMFITAMALEIPIYFMMKHTLFFWPLGTLWRKMGGISIDRTKSNSVVNQMVEAFNRHDTMYLCITPEGTRKKVDYWKLGFYHMAHEAGVPVVMAYIDYKRKFTGVGGEIHTTGDIETDFEKLRQFYVEHVGLNPAIKPRELTH